MARKWVRGMVWRQATVVAVVTLVVGTWLDIGVINDGDKPRYRLRPMRRIPKRLTGRAALPGYSVGGNLQVSVRSAVNLPPSSREFGAARSSVN